MPEASQILSSAGATNTKDGCQANFSMFVRRNVDASDTCHFRPLKLIPISLDAAYDVDLCRSHEPHAFTANDLCSCGKFFSPKPKLSLHSPKTFPSVPAVLHGTQFVPAKIRGAPFNRYPDLYRRRVLQDPSPSKSSTTSIALKVCLLEQRLVLLRHHVVLNLGHEVHGNDHNDQQRGSTKIERNVVLQDQELWQQTHEGDVHSTCQCQANQQSCRYNGPCVHQVGYPE